MIGKQSETSHDSFSTRQTHMAQTKTLNSNGVSYRITAEHLRLTVWNIVLGRFFIVGALSNTALQSAVGSFAHE